MTALPDDGPPEDEYWDDEWNKDDWHALNVIDRSHRNEDTWRGWALKLVAIALGLPVVLGILVYLLILIF